MRNARGERDIFDEWREEWLASFRHRFVLVKERTLVGNFDTQEDALVEGARRFGLQSFLVRRVEDHEEVVAPALTLGLLHVDLARTVRGG